jgi:hypothetical protein
VGRASCGRGDSRDGGQKARMGGNLMVHVGGDQKAHKKCSQGPFASSSLTLTLRVSRRIGACSLLEEVGASGKLSKFIGNSSGTSINAGSNAHMCALQEVQTCREVVRTREVGAMSVIAGVAKAAGARVLTVTRPTPKVFPTTARTLVSMALALLALVAIAALILASHAPSTEHLLVGSNDSKSGAAAPVYNPGTAPQMSEKAALNAYGKLPLSFIPNEGQTDKVVRYYAQGAGYGFFFTHKGAMLSFAEGKGHGHALALDFLGADPDATLEAQKRLSGEVNYLQGNDPTKWQQGLPTHGELLYGGLWPGIDMAVRGEGGKLKYEFHLQPGASVEDVRLSYRGGKGAQGRGRW